jgi:release factor glutamine methyltransferase
MVKEVWTIQKLIDWTTQFFINNNIQNPRLDTEVLLSHSLKLDRLGLYLNYDKPLTEDELSSFKKFIQRRANREPLQYITGNQEFWSLDFKVAPGALIPRQETEVLVEEILKDAGCKAQDAKITANSETGNKALASVPKPLILDLCTGCGCIAVALAKELTGSTIHAIDNSEVALEVARQNSERHDVKDRITFISGDLFQPLNNLGCKFDFIVSNPPYVKSTDLEGLEPEVNTFEPVSALDGGKDGLDVIRSIIDEAPKYLNSNGRLLLEIAFDQATEVEAYIEKSGCYTSSTVIKDLSGNDRVVKAQV